MLSAPGGQSVFFVALRWAPRPFRGARAKNNTTQGVFFCYGPGERQGKEKPRRHGARQKKNTTQGWCFFLLWPRAGRGKKKKNTTQGVVFFFAAAPAAGKGRRSPVGRRQNTLGGVFFLLWPRAGTGLLLPLPFPGAGAKKKTAWVVFSLAAAPRGRSLTHCGPGWRCLPSPGWCFCFCCGPARTGVVFFLLWPRPDAHSLTVGWGDFGKARVVFFFAAAPPGLFRQ